MNTPSINIPGKRKEILELIFQLGKINPQESTFKSLNDLP